MQKDKKIEEKVVVRTWKDMEEGKREYGARDEKNHINNVAVIAAAFGFAAASPIDREFAIVRNRATRLL